MSTGSHQQLADTFVSLADTMVDDFDLLDFLGLLAEKASEHLNITAAGVVLSDQRGGWHPTAGSSEAAELVELFAAQTHDGPCMDSVRTAAPVSSPDLTREDRWPAFVNRAVRAGYRAAAAVPMRSRHQIIGSLTLLDASLDGIDQPILQLGQALADMATIGLLHQSFSRHGDLLAEQLQAALNHRVVVEQAKGILAETGQVTPGAAYVLLRDYARNHGQHLVDLARQLATHTIRARDLFGTHTDTRPRSP